MRKISAFSQFGADDDLFEQGAPVDYKVGTDEAGDYGFRFTVRSVRHPAVDRWRKRRMLDINTQVRQAYIQAEKDFLSEHGADEPSELSEDLQTELSSAAAAASDTVREEAQEQMGADMVCEAVLQGWGTYHGKDFVPTINLSDDGPDLDFSVDNAKRVFGMPFTKPALALLLGKANRDSNYRQEAEADLAGN